MIQLRVSTYDRPLFCLLITCVSFQLDFEDDDNEDEQEEEASSAEEEEEEEEEEKHFEDAMEKLNINEMPQVVSVAA